jgi:hypothetical protein
VWKATTPSSPDGTSMTSGIRESSWTSGTGLRILGQLRL